MKKNCMYCSGVNNEDLENLATLEEGPIQVHQWLEPVVIPGQEVIWSLITEIDVPGVDDLTVELRVSYCPRCGKKLV